MRMKKYERFSLGWELQKFFLSLSAFHSAICDGIRCLSLFEALTFESLPSIHSPKRSGRLRGKEKESDEGRNEKCVSGALFKIVMRERALI